MTLQTPLSIVAMMVAMLILHVVMQFSVRAKQVAVHTEVQSIATGVAHDVFSEIGLHPFDAATAGSEVTDRSALTPEGQFNSEGKTYETASDVDDFHNVAYTYKKEEGFDFDFTLNITVRYVDEDNPSVDAGSQTFAKMVKVRIENPNLPAPLELEILYTYP